MERRTFTIDALEVRQGSDDETPMIRGHAAVFNKKSEPIYGVFRERIEPGAFTKTLKNADVRALFNHNPDYILGRARGVKKDTLRLSEDKKGLAIEIDPPETQFANDLLVSIKRGDISQMSFAFTTVSDSWNKERGEDVRTLHEVELHDVSPVTYPAYKQTDVSVRSTDDAVRSHDAWQKTLTDEDQLASTLAARQREIDL